MAKERMINTRIWSDTWVSGLDPLEKLLFLYFLTNTYTNISGIYELPMKVAAVETGIDPSMFEKMLPHLEPKIIYKHGWVILPNFPKYQNIENPKIMAGIQRELAEVPKEIHTLSIAYGYPIALIPILNLTEPNSIGAQNAHGITIENEDKPVKKKKESPEYEKIYRLFGVIPMNWAVNRTEINAAKNLLAEHGIGKCTEIYEEYKSVKDIEFCPQIFKPSDLDRKWVQLADFIKKSKTKNQVYVV